jgi:hypothetical protein
MELIGYYLLFAFSISLTAAFYWFIPLLREAHAQGISNSMTQNPKLSFVVYVLISAVVAPLLIFPMFSSNLEQHFVAGLRKEMLSPDQEKQT